MNKQDKLNKWVSSDIILATVIFILLIAALLIIHLGIIPLVFYLIGAAFNLTYPFYAYQMFYIGIRLVIAILK